MIVNIAAWLYMAQAGLCLVSLATGRIGMGEALLLLLFAGLFGATGYGLLKRLHWGRWLALGASLLGWTLGSLLLLLFAGYLLTVAPLGLLLGVMFGAGIFSVFALGFLFILLLWLTNIVVSFKLFWHLWSEAGAEEFGATPGVLQELGASAGAWLVVCVINVMVTGGGKLALHLPDAQDPAVTASTAEREADRKVRGERDDYAERRARSEAMLRAQAELEAAQSQSQAQAEDEDEIDGGEDPDEDESEEEMAVPEFEGGLYASNQQTPPENARQSEQGAAVNSPAGPSTEEEEDSETSRSKGILKCIDASGGTIYTQGYCPPGSRPARAAP